jgi:hypothetical protein
MSLQKSPWLLIILSLNIVASCGSENSNFTSSKSSTRLASDRLGVNIHRPTGDDGRFLFGKAQELGVGWVRIDVAWDDIEIAKGEYKWSRADEPIKEAASRGLKILANLHATPRWANRDKGTTVAPDRTEDWVDFCKKSAERYNGQTEGLPRIEIFGIWNEPDGSGLVHEDKGRTSPQLYVEQILKPCSEAIRKARPDAKTAGPELASKTDYLKDVLGAAGASLDIITVHKYSDHPEGVTSHMQKIRSILEGSSKTKGKPIWLTETGWSTKSTSKCWFGTVEDKVQAEKSKSLLTLIESQNWIAKVFFYELRDDNSEGACQWGLLRRDGTEKPWYQELKSYLKNQSPKDSKEIPWGSYRSSCRRERIEKNVLIAECKTKNNQWKSNKLSTFATCKDIQNQDGNLVCISSVQPSPNPPNPGTSLPEGSYRNSCKIEEVKNDILFAMCKDNKGKLKATSLSPFKPCQDIVNDNGNLICK